MISKLIFNIQKIVKRKAIITFAWIALAFTLLSTITLFIDNEFNVRFPSVWIIISLVLGLSPSILMVIYISKFQPKLKFAISCMLATISALKGMSKKIFVIIAMLIGTLSQLIDLIDLVTEVSRYIEKGYYIYLLSDFMWIIGYISLYTALLFFCVKYRIPTILSVSSKKKSDENMSSEQALNNLKDELEDGLITEEEYQAHRMDIISKL